MPKILLLTLLLVAVGSCAFAQVAINSNPVGLSLSGCDVASNQSIGMLSNPGALALVGHSSASLFYENRLGLSELSTKGMAATYSGKFGSVGLLAANFGFHTFNSSRYGLAYGRTFANNRVSAGFQLNCHDDFQIGAGHYSTLFSNVGVVYQATKKLAVGVHCYNPEQAAVRYPGYDMALPSYVEVGTNWTVIAYTKVFAEVEQYIGENTGLGVGMESSVKEMLYFRAGYKITENSFSWGIGAKLHQFDIDTGFAYQMPLGLTSAVSLTWNFTPKAQ